MVALGAQLDVSIIIEPSDGIAASDQTFEKLFSAHVVLDARRINSGPVSSHPNLVTDFELLAWHVRDDA
jgi:hypothetical protein